MRTVFARRQCWGQSFALLCGAVVPTGCPLTDPYFLDPSDAAAENAPRAEAAGADAISADAARTDATIMIDDCPADPVKTQPGNCGCGFPETSLCLLHRYSFDVAGTAAPDSVGTATGTAVNCSQANGGVTMAGANQYMDLPDGIVSVLTSGTIEAWVTWTGTSGAWQRIFDFGSSNGPAGDAGLAGLTYLYLTPQNPAGLMQVGYTESGYSNQITMSGAAFRTGVMTHVAVVADVTQQILALYVEGVLQRSIPFPGSLSHIHDVNNWLGRSQFSVDPNLAGTIHELRIFSVARSGAQIAAGAAAGPDALPNQ